jgi:hypothetical protein
MAWIKCTDRMPEVLPDRSEGFIVREIETNRIITSWYGRSANCVMVKRPSKWEWWDDKVPTFSLQDMKDVAIAMANWGEGFDGALTPNQYFKQMFNIDISAT